MLQIQNLLSSNVGKFLHNENCFRCKIIKHFHAITFKLTVPGMYETQMISCIYLNLTSKMTHCIYANVAKSGRKKSPKILVQSISHNAQSTRHEIILSVQLTFPISNPEWKLHEGRQAWTFPMYVVDCYSSQYLA